MRVQSRRSAAFCVLLRFPGLLGATSANGDHVAADSADRLFISKADSLQAQCQPGLTARLCCHLKTLSYFLLTCSSSQTRLSHCNSAVYGFNIKQCPNSNFKPMFQSAQRGFTLLSTPWLLWLFSAEFPAVKPEKTSAGPFPRCHWGGRGGCNVTGGLGSLPTVQTRWRSVGNYLIL